MPPWHTTTRTTAAHAPYHTVVTRLAEDKPQQPERPHLLQQCRHSSSLVCCHVTRQHGRQQLVKRALAGVLQAAGVVVSAG